MKVLLLTIDAWRASHASFLPGAERECTPELARLGEESVAFGQAVSHGPATPYAFPGILTSTYPLDHGGYERTGDDRTLVSEALAEAGWRCVGVHSNPWLGEKYGYDRGYDDYRDVGEFDLPFLEWGRDVLLDNFGLDHPVYRAAQTVYRRVQAPLRALGGGTADEVRAASEALDGAGDDSFVWVHLLAPHAPYDPPERHRAAEGVGDVDGTALTTRAQRAPEDLSAAERETVRDLYAASVRHADEQAGRIVSAADEDTLVIVTADHGEALFEHGVVGHPPRLYDELLHVPLLIRPPKGAGSSGGSGGPDGSGAAETHGGSAAVDAQAPGVVDEQVRHVDLAPTILDYAGADVPASYRGRSLRPAVEGRGCRSRPAIAEVASTEARPGQLDPDALRICVRTPGRKVTFADGAVEGHDLDADPGERRAVADPEGGEWSRLRRVLRDRRDEIAFETGGVEFDASTEERLRDLGYLE